MIKEIEHFLDCRKHLKNNMSKFIEAFVSYYGEEHREEIKKKFTNAIILAYRKPTSIENFLDNYSEEVSKSIIHKYYKESQLQIQKEALFYENLRFNILQPLYKYNEFYHLYQLGPEGRLEEYKKEELKRLQEHLPKLTKEEFEEMIRTQTISEKYKQVRSWLIGSMKIAIDISRAEKKYEKAFNECKDLLHKIDSNISLSNFSYYMDNSEIKKLNKLAAKYPEITEEYKRRMSKYKDLQAMVEQDRNKKNQLSTKYYIQLVEENIDLLSEEGKKQFEQYKHDTRATILPEEVANLFGYSVRKNCLLDYFSEESDKILEDPKVAQWQKKPISEERVRYFKTKGLDLGENYDAYVNSKEAKKIWPTKESVEHFIESRDRLLNEFNIEYYSSHPEHQAAREEIDKLGLLVLDDSFDASLYSLSDAQTFISPNLIKTENGVELYPVGAINCDFMNGYVDHYITHELNHIYEMAILSANENSYEITSGWDVLNVTINQNKQPLDTLYQRTKKRQYELFSEIIDELIAQDISQIMKKNNIYVFDTPKKAEYKNATSYEDMRFLVEGFFQEFKKEIIESRHDGNIQIIWDTVGKKNFDELNELFRTYNEKLNGYSAMIAIKDLKEGKETEQTRFIHELERRRDIILDNMRKHSLTHKQEDKKEDEKVRVA